MVIMRPGYSHTTGELVRDRIASRAAQGFNARFPIGPPVIYWPGDRVGTGVRGEVRAAAGVLRHTAVVWVTGCAEAVRIVNVEPIEEDKANVA